MRLTPQQVRFDPAQKTASLAAPAQDQPAAGSSTAKAQQARDLLRGMAADLVSNGSVKGGYLRLRQDGDGSRLGAGHFGSGYSAATDLVKNLVRDAYGDVASKALEDYLGRSKGGKVGTQSFVKLVRSLEQDQLSDQVKNARIDPEAKLRTYTSEGQTLGEVFKFDSDMVTGMQRRLDQLSPQVTQLMARINDPSQDPAAFLDQGRSKCQELDGALKLLMMRPNVASLPGVSEVQQGLRGLLADLQFDLANALIAHHQLGLHPEVHRDPEPSAADLTEVKNLLKMAEANARVVGNEDLAHQSATTHKDLFEIAPVQAQLLSEQDQQFEDLQAQIDEFRTGHKTEMQPPEMPRGGGNFESVSSYQRGFQAPHQEQSSVASAPVKAQEQVQEAVAQLDPGSIVPKEVVPKDQQGVWFLKDLKSRLEAMGCGSSEAAFAELAPRAEAIVRFSFEDNDAALNFLEQAAQSVKQSLDDRLEHSADLNFDAYATAQGLKNIDVLIEQVYTQPQVPAHDYLTLSILLNMQRN